MNTESGLREMNNLYRAITYSYFLQNCPQRPLSDSCLNRLMFVKNIVMLNHYLSDRDKWADKVRSLKQVMYNYSIQILIKLTFL
jgi:hypothetical protein